MYSPLLQVVTFSSALMKGAPMIVPQLVTPLP